MYTFSWLFSWIMQNLCPLPTCQSIRRTFYIKLTTSMPVKHWWSKDGVICLLALRDRLKRLMPSKLIGVFSYMLFYFVLVTFEGSKIKFFACVMQGYDTLILVFLHRKRSITDILLCLAISVFVPFQNAENVAL